MPVPLKMLVPVGGGHTRRMSAGERSTGAAFTRRLVLVGGQEGAGKSTIIRALLPHTPNCARIDGEDVGQTNPCPMDDEFFGLLRRNVAGLVQNFWAAGYVNVIAGSFLRDYPDYLAFRQLLSLPTEVFLVELLVYRDVRDRRRVTRTKQTTQQWRDTVDLIPQDRTIREAADADYRYIGLDTTGLDVTETVHQIMDAIPEIYRQ
jgi:energy-coupling factor transporter ATP-binding protein EcfA2